MSLIPINDIHYLTDLHIDVTLPRPGLRIRHTLTTREEQEALQGDVRAFISEWLQRLESPVLNAQKWPSARVELVSEDTRRYIDRLERLAREAAEQVEDDALAERIESLIDGRV